MYAHCTIGWVDIGTSTVVQSGFVYFHEHGKRQKKCFGQVTI
jgi:hypothetical protein